MTNGLRCYLLVEGGIEATQFLGSSSTFSLAGFGGLLGKNLAVGNVLSFHSAIRGCRYGRYKGRRGFSRPLTTTQGSNARRSSRLRVITEDGLRSIFAEWRVDHNSSRTGVRLLGPKIEWARENGGEAGLHPSNIHDNAYAFGALT